MTHRAVLVLVIVAAMASVQLVASFASGPRTSGTTATVQTARVGQAPKLTGAGVALADNGEDNNGSNDNSDNSGGSSDNNADNGSSDNSDNSGDSSDNSSDNSSSDNSSDNSSSDNSSDNSSNDNSSDNGSNDNSDNSSSNSSGDNSADASTGTENPDEIIDNVAPTDAAPVAPTTSTATRTDAAPPASSAPSAAPSPSPVAVTEVTATANGIDTTLALPGNRVSVQIPSTLPLGTTLKLKMVDPLTLPPTPGIRAGDLIFQLTATDASGVSLTTLPAEVNLTVTYTDRDVLGLNEAAITLGHLDPVDNLWKASSRQVANATANTVASPVSDTGAYAVYVP
jgi:hypothetical protein